MNESTSHLVSYLSTLGVLAVLSGVCFVTHDTHADQMVIALCTFAGVYAPRSPVPARLGQAGAAALVVGSVLLGGTLLPGCGASPALVVSGVEAAAEFTCAGAHKGCELFGESRACRWIEIGCAVVAPGADPPPPSALDAGPS